MNKLKAYWIVARSALITVWYSSQVILFSFIGKCSRKRADNIIENWASALLNTVKLSFEVKGQEHLNLKEHARYIFMCNHASLYDIPLSYLALPNSLRMVAKKELFQVPIWGRAMKKSEFISIDRNDSKQAMKDLEDAKDKMQSGIHLWIAPEGTRSTTGELQKFKPGGFLLAFQTQATIIPIAIQGAAEVLPSKSLDFQLGKHAKITVCPPIDVSTYTTAERRKLIQDVKDSISNALSSENI